MFEIGVFLKYCVVEENFFSMTLNDSDFTNKLNSNETKIAQVCFEWLEMFAQATVLVVVMLTFVFRVVSVSGTSMMDTLFNGDRLIVRKWYYKPKNGDIVVISKGQNLDMPIIKRVIATEGQTLKIDYDLGKVIVDGETLDEFYIKEPMMRVGDIEVPVVIPRGHTFVMRDNRNDSWDSRFAVVGLIKNENIIGCTKLRVYPFERYGYLN